LAITSVLQKNHFSLAIICYRENLNKQTCGKSAKCYMNKLSHFYIQVAWCSNQ